MQLSQNVSQFVLLSRGTVLKVKIKTKQSPFIRQEETFDFAPMVLKEDFIKHKIIFN